MLDIRLIRENAEAVNTALQKRNATLNVDGIVKLDAQRLAFLQEEEKLRGERNQLSKAVGEAKKSGGNADDLLAESKRVADRIKELETEKEKLAEEQNKLLMDFPNLPHAETPVGGDESQNVVVKTWGDEFKNRYKQPVLPHYEIGTNLGILDFERGVKLAHSRFTVLRGMGSKLERALINFMLDTHAQHGYEEVLPPFLVNREAMTGTGQLPKFEEDMYKLSEDELFLIPTAEVPVTNMFRDEILDEALLPLSFCAYTPCFRREAGAAGRDTRGLIRQHQFDKVELVKFTTPETSDAEHQKLLSDAERILQLLELPYRVVALCTGDMGFAAARCFDIEVWMPGQGESGLYREISSCSVFTDFQARRANLKYRDSKTGKPALLHTLNGSGLAVGRTLAAILENYQIGNSEVSVPAVLRPYLQCDVIQSSSVTLPQSSPAGQK